MEAGQSLKKEELVVAQAPELDATELPTLAADSAKQVPTPNPVPTALNEPLRRVDLARHPQRPYTLDYVDRIFADWSEIHGDRAFGDDPAIVCGMARFHGDDVCVIGIRI